MVLDAKEMVWAKMAARVQKSREELIGVLGLLNRVSTAANHDASLSSAAESILENMANFFLLEYCCLFAQDEGEFIPVASCGVAPPSWLKAEIEKLALSPSPASETISLPHGRRTALALPLSGGDRRLGSLVLIPVHEPEEKDRRHYRLAADAMASTMENFLLREKLAGMGRLLETSFLNQQNGIMELKQQSLRNRAFLDSLMLKAPLPVFMLDESGKLLRFNQALEKLVGWDGDKLTGRCLEGFLPRREDWREVCRILSGENESADSFVEIKVQDGRLLKVRLSLTSLDGGGNSPDFLGSMRPATLNGIQESTTQALDKAGELYNCAMRAAGETMEAMASIRTGLQVLLLRDLPPDLKRRLGMLEELTHDAGQSVAALRKAMDEFRNCDHRRQADQDIWPD